MGKRIDWLLGRTADDMAEPAGGDRATEATAQQRWASGASGGSGYFDPIDTGTANYGFRRVGRGSVRDMPQLSRERAQVDSIAGYRVNPMARAIIDTYIAFVVGDAGLTVATTSDEVRPVLDQFWQDPRNALVSGQELMFKDWLLRGEQAQEMMVGEMSGVTRRSPIDVARVLDVALHNGNPLWPESLAVSMPNSQEPLWLAVIGLDDVSELRQGEVFWWPAFKTLETDQRGTPFLTPVLDWLDNYDMVLSNLIDRTALMRYISWDVTLKGADGDAINAWIAARGGTQIPRSGTMEVHNDEVDMKPVTASTGAFEDVKTNQAVLTNVAGGTGLSKTWLAEPEDANRATSLTMAEPVRRRIGSVQNQWLANIQEMCRFAVDRAVEAGRLPLFVDVPQAGGEVVATPPAMTVSVTGPQIAAADSQMMATVMLQLSQGLAHFVEAGVMSTEAAKIAAEKAWSDYCGVPYRSELDAPDRVDDLAEHIEDNATAATRPLLAAVGGTSPT